jgi:hypothetical protein
VASGAAEEGAIHVFIGGADVFSNLPGTHIGSCRVSPTGGAQVWADIECPVAPTTGVHDVYLRASGNGDEALFNLDYFQFE